MGADAKGATRGTILVVDDEDLVARHFARLVEACGWTPRVACDAASAIQALDELCCGLIADVHLMAGSGFDVVVAARARDPKMPVLVVTGWNEPDTANRAQLLAVEYACKPNLDANIKSFLARCNPRRADRAASLVEALVGEHGLSPTQRRIVGAAFESAHHERLSAELGMNRNTLKTHARAILEKTGAESLEEIAIELRSRLLRS